jgi:hypothetical protein
MTTKIDPRRRARMTAAARSPVPTCLNTPPRPDFLLTGRDATGRVVALDRVDSPARAASIADLWRYAGLQVDTAGGLAR